MKLIGMAREFSEELLGEPERDGSSGEPLDYENWSLYRELEQARDDDRVRTYCLGVGLDTRTLTATVLTVLVFDDDLFDSLFGDTVRTNAEGELVSSAALRADPGMIPGVVDELLRLDPGAAATVDRHVRARAKSSSRADVRRQRGAGAPARRGEPRPGRVRRPGSDRPDAAPEPARLLLPGPHRCVGAALARTVLGTMVGALVELPSVALDGEPTWITGVLIETQLAALQMHVGDRVAR